MGLIGLYDLHQFPYISRVLMQRLFSGTPGTKRIFQLAHALYVLENKSRCRLRNMRLYQVPIPPVCIFSVTHRCNLDCQGCHARSCRDGHQLSWEEIGTVIRNVSGYGTSIFVITGGEPLLVPGLVHCLGKQEKCLFYLFSNGTLFGRDAIHQLSQCRNIMPVISYEGNDVITDLRRGSGTASKIRKTLKALRDHNILFGVSVTATRLNLDVITSSSFSDEVSSLRAACLFIINYHPACPGDGLALTDGQRALIARRVQDLRKRSPFIIFNLPFDESPEGRCAGGGKGLIHIDASGNVSPCPFITEASGNIFAHDFIDILRMGLMTGIRKMALEGPDIIRPCEVARDVCPHSREQAPIKCNSGLTLHYAQKA
jgi:MoaA/NifB/PqqE/SkfB family radical SAM enzyme